jgi:chromosome segregation ATPase
LDEELASLREVNSSLEDRLSSTARIIESKAMEQSKSSSDDVIRDDVLSLKAQIRNLEQENDRLSALLAECRAETIDASRIHADDQETIFELRNALEEKHELLQSIQQETTDHKGVTHEAELHQWISRVDALENELGELKNQETGCVDCEQRNLQLANVMESLNDLQIENQGLKAEILLWKSADDGGKGVSQKVNFEKEMNAAHKRFVSMERSLQESIKRLEKDKEKLVAAHHDEILRKTEQHDKTRIELSAWKLEMQNALNDIESLKRENDDLRNSFDTVSHPKTNSS